jgi:hypothetical protein
LDPRPWDDNVTVLFSPSCFYRWQLDSNQLDLGIIKGVFFLTFLSPADRDGSWTLTLDHGIMKRVFFFIIFSLLLTVTGAGLGPKTMGC